MVDYTLILSDAKVKYEQSRSLLAYRVRLSIECRPLVRMFWLWTSGGFGWVRGGVDRGPGVPVGELVGRPTALTGKRPASFPRVTEIGIERYRCLWD